MDAALLHLQHYEIFAARTLTALPGAAWRPPTGQAAPYVAVSPDVAIQPLFARREDELLAGPVQQP